MHPSKKYGVGALLEMPRGSTPRCDNPLGELPPPRIPVGDCGVSLEPRNEPPTCDAFPMLSSATLVQRALANRLAAHLLNRRLDTSCRLRNEDVFSSSVLCNHKRSSVEWFGLDFDEHLVDRSRHELANNHTLSVPWKIFGQQRA